jgi:3-hydroxybutyryl-CoA dehydrogenase
MGAGIAQVVAAVGVDVLLLDVEEAKLGVALDAIRQSVTRLARKGGSPPDEVLARIETAVTFPDPLDADIAIEAVVEDEDVKRSVVVDLDLQLPEQAILATNTSSLPITRLARATRRPDRVIGMHFMNPAPLLPLVEIIRGLDTSDRTASAVIEFARRLGKTPVEAADYPGFISNRVLMPMINEAIYCLMEGVGDARAIDEVMRLGMRPPLGPLELADLIGLDTCLAVIEVMHGRLGDPRYRPCPLLRSYVDAGRLGRKAGRGFYAYDESGRKAET